MLAHLQWITCSVGIQVAISGSNHSHASCTQEPSSVSEMKNLKLNTGPVPFKNTLSTRVRKS